MERRMTTRMNVCLRPCACSEFPTLIRPIAAAEELSEEDQQLKNELDMLVERLTV